MFSFQEGAFQLPHAFGPQFDQLSEFFVFNQKVDIHMPLLVTKEFIRFLAVNDPGIGSVNLDLEMCIRDRV